MGRAKPAPYPHIFPSITSTPREPLYRIISITWGGGGVWAALPPTPPHLPLFIEKLPFILFHQLLNPRFANRVVLGLWVMYHDGSSGLFGDQLVGGT